MVFLGEDEISAKEKLLKIVKVRKDTKKAFFKIFNFMIYLIKCCRSIFNRQKFSIFGIILFQCQISQMQVVFLHMLMDYQSWINDAVI